MVLVVVERDGDGTLTEGSAEVLAAARDLAESLGVPVEAVAVGEPGDLPDDLVKRGVGRLHLLVHELLDDLRQATVPEPVPVALGDRHDAGNGLDHRPEVGPPAVLVDVEREHAQPRRAM